jgi:methylmalonyl-CoA decarboxylase
MIKAEIVENFGVLTLDNAQKRNCLSAALIEELVAEMEKMRQARVRVLILRAPAGSKTWSAGHDVRELPTSGKDPLTYNDPLRCVVREIQEFPAPVIAMVEGGVWGGACEMVMSCDLVIAAENTTFAITPAKLGVPYNISGVLNFSKNVSQVIVKELLFTAQPITAQRAEQVGIVNHVVTAEELEAFTYNISRTIAQNSPLVISVLKEELRVLSQAYPLMPNTFERIQGLRRDVYNSGDYHEGVNAFFDRRKPVFTGN